MVNYSTAVSLPLFSTKNVCFAKWDMLRNLLFCFAKLEIQLLQLNRRNRDHFFLSVLETFFIQIMQGSSYNITRSFYLLIYFIIQNCCQQYVKLQKLLKPLEPKKTLELLKPPGPPKLKKLLELLKLLELCYQPRNKATRTEATVLGKGNSV